jgi:hypothetical protein
MYKFVVFSLVCKSLLPSAKALEEKPQPESGNVRKNDLPNLKSVPWNAIREIISSKANFLVSSIPAHLCY